MLIENLEPMNHSKKLYARYILWFSDYLTIPSGNGYLRCNPSAFYAQAIVQCALGCTNLRSVMTSHEHFCVEYEWEPTAFNHLKDVGNLPEGGGSSLMESLVASENLLHCS